MQSSWRYKAVCALHTPSLVGPYSQTDLQLRKKKKTASVAHLFLLLSPPFYSCSYITMEKNTTPSRITAARPLSFTLCKQASRRPRIPDV